MSIRALAQELQGLGFHLESQPTDFDSRITVLAHQALDGEKESVELCTIRARLEGKPYFRVTCLESGAIEIAGLPAAFEQGLADWVAKEGGLAQEAAKRIKSAYHAQSTELRLSRLHLKTLPSEINALTALKELDLSYNRLHALPALNLPTLEVLDLNNNQLGELPALDLPALRGLYLSGNQLHKLPALDLPALQGLHLGSNQLGELPALDLPALETLVLNNNQLRELPTLNLPALIWLYLYDNQLHELSTLNLPALKVLYLQENQLHSLPSTIGQSTGLHSLRLHHNAPLAELPLSMQNCIALTELDVEGTEIPPADRDALLAACQAKRAAVAAHLLPAKVAFWSRIAGKGALDTTSLTEQEQIGVHEWLTRLERCRDFRGNQKQLAGIVCDILNRALTSPSFKETFFAQVVANLECCQDRAAMSLNEIYTAWRIDTLAAEAPIAQKLEMMLGVSRTLALRQCLQEEMHKRPEGDLGENVEIFLYYETTLREPLQLESAIRSMAYEHVGKRGWINEESLMAAVDERQWTTLVGLEPFKKLVEEDPAFMREWAPVLTQYRARLEALDDQDLKGFDYKTATDSIMREQEQAWAKQAIAWAKERAVIRT